MLRVLHMSTIHYPGDVYEVCLLVDGRQYAYTLPYEVQHRKMLSLLKKGFKGLALNYVKKVDAAYRQGGA
jgi:hypothetical protein